MNGDRASYRNNSGIVQKIRNVYCRYKYFGGNMGGAQTSEQTWNLQ